jgi:hypothetical protein
MAFSWKKNLLFSFIFVVAGISTLAFWYEANTWFTEFSFDLSGEVKTLSLVVSWSEQSEFNVYLQNRSSDLISGRFSFVDAIDIWNGVIACKSDNETWDIWQYLTTTPLEFLLSWWETLVKTIQYRFPSWWSWLYYGCVTYIPYGDIDDWKNNPIPRKALILQVTLNPEEVWVSMIANLWSRGNANTSNLNGYQSKWKLLFYNPLDRSAPQYSWYVLLNEDWWWELSGLKVLAWCYDVVYKWFHHLSSYITNVCIESGSQLNFVSWSSLSWVGIFDEELPYNGWFWYQVAWDMPRSTNDYDNVINWTDLSVLYERSLCPYMERVEKWHVCDLNNDTWVDSSDASAILANLDKKDPSFYSWENIIPLYEGFGMINYFSE